MFDTYDVIVVGGGHAGNEAAIAASNMNASVLLVTMNMQTIGQMSCNPAMGGVAKGQIVREIDALNGLSGIVTDHTMIQFRMLNRSKGPAMWSPRAQSDRMAFAGKWRELMEARSNISFWQDMVTGLIVEQGRVTGVRTAMGHSISSRAVVLTNGTFLNGIIHIGEKQYGGGRAGERPATGITEQLQSLGFESGRMKTGTPPRVDGRTLDYSVMELQEGDQPAGKFSFTDTPELKDQVPCHIVYTHPGVHDILKEGFSQSPMFTGRIQGSGPRYCPSIEDKIERFAGRDRHQLFVEPEGRNTVEIYVNGFSSSLPEEIQFRALRQIPGFERAKMFRPGYAIEYDYFPPTQLLHTLETKLVKNLFFAGQINGTTGYEEAAGQGLIAGINAVRKVREEAPFVLSRAEAYIGVLIDDLINKGTKEPYRMFTSRAEFRILLRQDNADLRLTPLAVGLGMQGMDARYQRVRDKEQGIHEIKKFVAQLSVSPEEVNSLLEEIGTSPIPHKVKLQGILLRPKIDFGVLRNRISALHRFLTAYEEDTIRSAEISIKYQGYIDREKDMVQKMTRLERVKIPEHIDFSTIHGLSSEAVEKLANIQPQSIGQAGRISGVSPSDISVLLIHLGR